MKSEQGAEAVVSRSGEKVIKTRVEKSYRHKKLDKRIREARTKREKENMDKARKNKANVPKANINGSSELEIEYIEGEELHSRLKESDFKEAGVQVSKIHEANVIHGDLTPRNILVAENSVYIIDFGLSQSTKRLEDKATDLYLLKQTIEAESPENAQNLWKSFKKGYLMNGKKDVVDKVHEIEERGRYQ